MHDNQETQPTPGNTVTYSTSSDTLQQSNRQNNSSKKKKKKTGIKNLSMHCQEKPAQTAWREAQEHYSLEEILVHFTSTQEFVNAIEIVSVSESLISDRASSIRLLGDFSGLSRSSKPLVPSRGYRPQECLCLSDHDGDQFTSEPAGVQPHVGDECRFGFLVLDKESRGLDLSSRTWNLATAYYPDFVKELRLVATSLCQLGKPIIKSKQLQVKPSRIFASGGFGHFFAFKELQEATWNFDEKAVIGVSWLWKIYLRL
ncbi:hypothetical protein CRG98_007461 [Punica granatum]|uniref:Uncharacterized protein n=1 Tax=Punica granatum TaxID=22663 RepID=A0A2I0KUK1_PUNGR|nr:hypothetical protein CRG98_007461 [Punica granatum]